jgi:hypothetical protein
MASNIYMNTSNLSLVAFSIENKIKQIDDLIDNNNKKEEKKEINDEIKKDKERPVSAFGSGVRSKYLRRFHKQ